MDKSTSEKMDVEEIDRVEQNLKGLSIKSKDKKTVQFSSPTFAEASQIKRHAKGRAFTVDAISMAGKLKRHNKRKARVQIGKHYSMKKKLNFAEDDGQDDGEEKEFDLSLNETTLDESMAQALSRTL